MPPGAAELLWSLGNNDPDLMPNWSVEEDGSIRMDICSQCVVSSKPGDIEEPPI